jgi:LuxR family quorum sensing-dependent transcriptional regulator
VNANVLALDFIQDLDNRHCAESVSSAFQALIEQFGFSYFCIGSIKPDRDERGLVWATSFKHPWFRHWVECEHIHVDPVIWRLKRNGDPFRWAKLEEHHPGIQNMEVMDEAAEFGMRDGWSLAFRYGQRDIPAIAIGLGTPKFALAPENETALHLAAVYCGLKLGEFAQRQPSISDLLSTRERECLRWVASGKTDWDISEILGISQQTVHKHVSNALKKLNAATRAQAVAVALTTRQITL